MATPSTHTKLSAIQLHLLRFFSERPVSDSETTDLQHMIANYYTQKADERMEAIWAQRGYTEKTMDEVLNASLRNPADAAGH